MGYLIRLSRTADVVIVNKDDVGLFSCISGIGLHSQNRDIFEKSSVWKIIALYFAYLLLSVHCFVFFNLLFFKKNVIIIHVSIYYKCSPHVTLICHYSLSV